MKKLFLVLLSVLSASFSFAQTSKPMYVYTKDGLFDIYYSSDVLQMACSNKDKDGVSYPQMVSQNIYTKRGVVTIPLADIDSVSFVDPAPQVMKKEGKVNHLTSKGFRSLVWDYKENPDQLVFKGDRPVIVDYWAKWCGYCVAMMPTFEQLAEEYKGRIDFYKVDTDEETEVSNQLHIANLPCIYFYPKQGQPEIREGAMSLSAMREIIEKVLLITEDENPDAPKPQVDLKLWKGDEQHEWLDRKFTALLKCTSANATLVKYGCFVKDDIAYTNLSDRELIQRYGDVLAANQLPKVNSAAGLPITFHAQKGQTYVFLCLMKNAEGGVIVQREEVTTDAVYVPALDFQAERGALAQFIKDKQKHISVYMKTNDAKDVCYTCLLKEDFNKQREEGKSIEDILSQHATVLTAEQLASANKYGFSAVISGLQPLTDYVCLAMMHESNGKAHVAKVEVSTPFDGYNETMDDTEVKLVTGLFNNSMTCSMNCSTGDAIYASLLMIPSDELSKLLAKGETLETVMDTHSDVTVYSYQQMEYINGQGLSNVVSDVKPGTRYTWIGDIRGRFGGRTVERSEVKTLSEGETAPAIDTRLVLSEQNGMLTASVNCTTANATAVTSAVIESMALEKLLASGKTLEEVMTEGNDQFLQYETLKQDQLNLFNQGGVVLGCSNKIQPDKRYTWILDAKNKDGKRSVKRGEVKTTPVYQ